MRGIGIGVLMIGGLLAGCPTAADDGSEPPDPAVTPPTDDDDDVETWLYTGRVYGTEEPVDVYIGDDHDTTRPDNTWSFRSSAGPEARVDVIRDGSEAFSNSDCGRDHYAFFWTPQDAVKVPQAQVAITVGGAAEGMVLSGIFISVDASNTFREYLSHDDFEQDGDVHRLSFSADVGTLWRLHVWAREDGGMATDVVLEGQDLAEGSVLEEEAVLGPRIYGQVTLLGDAPADAETMQLTEALSFGDVTYSAAIYVGAPLTGEPILRMDAAADLTAYFFLPETDLCSGRTSQVRLAPAAGEAELGVPLEPPVLAPAAGVWTERPSLELTLPDDAESGSASVTNGEDADWTRWFLSTVAGCLEPSEPWPDALSGMDPALSTRGYGFARRDLWAASCEVTVEFPPN